MMTGPFDFLFTLPLKLLGQISVLLNSKNKETEMTITLEQLRKIFPRTKYDTLAQYVDPLNKTFAKFGIDTPLAIRAFLAQVGHESAGFSVIIENLNYSESGLLKTFGKYFTKATAKKYARNPEMIANRVYANRMGNGPESSGDGWKFRGKGVIQITGKDNHAAFAAYMNMPLNKATEYLLTVEGAVLSAGWFMYQNRLIDLLKVGSVTKVTKRVNGGTNGLADRLDIFNRSREIIN